MQIKFLQKYQMFLNHERMSPCYPELIDNKGILHSKKSPARPNVILQYRLLASILSAVCSVIQQS